MTSYSAMAARGREESAAKTKGRRKVTAERIEYDPAESNVVQFPGSPMARTRWVIGRLVGSCGHDLRRTRLPVDPASGEPLTTFYLTSKVGRKMTCMHDDCIIPPKPVREPREDDCTWQVGNSDNPGEWRRCRTRAQWQFPDGDPLCTRHRDYLLARGYLDGPGERITR